MRRAQTMSVVSRFQSGWSAKLHNGICLISWAKNTTTIDEQAAVLLMVVCNELGDDKYNFHRHGL